MRRTASLILLAALSACSAGPDADLQYIKQARSLAGEWALLNEQADQGRLTDIYVASMRGWLRQQLQITAGSLNQPDSRYGKEIRALRAEPAGALSGDLRLHAQKLKQIEDSLESA